uniref:Coatomer subunit zeta n=1 Tax=Fundulus heteroclitus TaxID=8078 RepID=A0A146XU27_FUNHE
MDSTCLEPSLYTVKAVFILDNDGNRLLSKYYDPELYPTMKDQKNFESNVFSKTHKADNEIAFLEGMTIVYKSSIDLFFYVVGSAQENELMLMSVLNCLFDSLSHILRKNVERRCLLDNMEGVFLVVDEIIDGGVILESDPQQVLQKVNYRADDNPLTEQSVAQVTHTADQATLQKLHLLVWGWMGASNYLQDSLDSRLHPGQVAVHYRVAQRHAGQTIMLTHSHT